MVDEFPDADAVLDPWCEVPLSAGTSVLFGFALRHPTTSGLGWLASTEIVALNHATSRARTRSGRRYGLGRRIELHDIPAEGEEPWVAYQLLLGQDAPDWDVVPPCVADAAADRNWLGLAMQRGTSGGNLRGGFRRRFEPFSDDTSSPTSSCVAV